MSGTNMIPLLTLRLADAAPRNVDSKIMDAFELHQNYGSNSSADDVFMIGDINILAGLGSPKVALVDRDVPSFGDDERSLRRMSKGGFDRTTVLPGGHVESPSFLYLDLPVVREPKEG